MKRKLTMEQARLIKFGKHSPTFLANYFKINRSAIYAIKNGKSWQWLSEGGMEKLDESALRVTNKS